MEQMTIIAGVMAMALGVLLFALGAYGWRPAPARAGGWLETPAAMAGALAWLLRFALRAGAAPARPSTTSDLDVTPQSPPRAPAAARPVHDGSPSASPRRQRRGSSRRRSTGRSTRRARA